VAKPAARTQGPAANPTRVVIDPARRVSTLDRRLLGSFLEHLGHTIYTGIYEPGIAARRLERFPH